MHTRLRANIRALQADSSRALTPEQRELRDGYDAIDAFVREGGGDKDVARRCQLYDAVLASAPNSPSRSFAALACGLAEPSWVESQGRPQREARRLEIQLLFETELRTILLQGDSNQRIAYLERHLQRVHRYGQTVGAAPTACLHLVLECVKAGRTEARRHFRTLRFLGWQPCSGNSLDFDLSKSLPSIIEQTVRMGDRQEITDGYSALCESIRAFSTTAGEATVSEWRQLAHKCEIRLGVPQLEANQAAGGWEEIHYKLEGIRTKHPAVYRAAQDLLREGRSEQGSLMADLRVCLRRLLEYPFFQAPRPPVKDQVDLDNLTADGIANIIKSLDGVYGHEDAKHNTIPRALIALGIHRREIREHKLDPERPVTSLLKNGIALQGPPGNGKTQLAKALADALGLPCCFISCGDLKLSEDIAGISRGHEGARPGILTEELRRAGTFRVVVVLDELSRASHEVLNALFAPTDPNQNTAWRDQYFGVPFDLSEVLWIATTNDFESLPEGLRHRFKEVDTAGFTRLEKKAFGIQQLEKWTRTIPEFAGWTLSEEVWTSLLNKFTDPGLRLLFRDGIYDTLLGAHTLGLPRGAHVITASDVARIEHHDRVAASNVSINGNDGQEIVMAAIARRRLSNPVSVPFLVGNRTWVLLADKDQLILAPGAAAEGARQKVALHIVGEDGCPVSVGETVGARKAFSWRQPLHEGKTLESLLLRDGSLCAVVHPL